MSLYKSPVSDIVLERAVNFYPPEGGLINDPLNRELTSSLAGLEKAAQSGRILEANAVLCDDELKLTVALGGVRGIIERGEAAWTPDGNTRDIAVITRVGRAVAFKVTGFRRDLDGVTAILSRREAQLECVRNRLSRLTAGDIIDARVTRTEQFGAFCDIGCGLVALIPIDRVSVSRVPHTSERFRCGESIKAIIRDIDAESGRVTLSHRELLGTWQENAELFAAGQTVAGIVRGVEDYGVFVELTPNLAGLAEFREGVETGMTAAVYIKSVIAERMKIKLVICDCYPSPSTPYSPPRYFLGEDETHIDYWRYSPRGCMKTVETMFGSEL